MARRKKRSKDIEVEKEVEKEMSKMGLNSKSAVGIILAIIGVILILFNLRGVILAFVGLVLIYFGLRMLGYDIRV